MQELKKTSNACSNVSVIIPAYNVESCLYRAIQSALDQSPSPFEVIVINDGSTDGTAGVACSFGNRIHYIEQSNQGQGAARNAGLVVARGEYIAFLDADDYWLPGFLMATTEFLISNPEAVAVSTGWKIRLHNEKIIKFPPAELNKEIPNTSKVLNDFFDFWGRFDHVRTGTVLIRNNTIKQMGLQQAHLRISQDLEYWGYIATAGPWGFIPNIYWVGDSALIAAKDGWLKKYRTRRKLCPTVNDWQERIIANLKQSDLDGFRKVRGRVAAGYVHSMILDGRFSDARKIVIKYGKEMPQSWLSRLIFFGNSLGYLGWTITCAVIIMREYQKTLFFSLLSMFKQKSMQSAINNKTI